MATELAEEPVLLAGRYTYVGELGSGSSGRVILARDATDGAARALKVVGPEAAARLGWEFETLHRIAHPHVASVHELLRVDARVGGAFRIERGATVLVEDHVEGQAAHRVARGLHADPAALARWTVRVGEAVARGLAAVHAAGLVHGDVKPANVVVTEEGGDARLVDLGLARPPGSDGTVAGTPGFLAPEAWHAERSVATDLYALGATLHHLLGGRAHIDEAGSSSVAALVQRALAQPRTVRSLPDGVPPALVRLVGALLDPDPARRPGTAREVAARLAAMAADLGVGSAAGGGLEDAPTPTERAMSLGALPLAGRDADLDSLVQALRERGVVALLGPSGSGRTRLFREAMRTVQRIRAESGERVPTCARGEGRLPSEVPHHDAILFVEAADAVDLRDARSMVRAADVEGVALTVVLERSEPLLDADATVQLEPLPPAQITALLASALEGRSVSARLSNAAVRASGALPGRLCRLLVEAVTSDRDIARPETLDEVGARPSETVPVPEPAADAAALLAVAGGAIAPDAVPPALRGEIASALAILVGSGLASLDASGRPRLRGDIARAIRRSLSPRRRGEIARRLDHSRLDGAALAFVRAASGDGAQAELAFLDAVRDRRVQGDPEGAARLAEEAIELLGASEALSVARADALRACGRYEAALAALSGASGPEGLLLSAEIQRLRGRRKEATALVEEAFEVLAAAPRDDLLALAHTTLARLCLDDGDLDASAARLRDARDLELTDGVRARVEEVGALVGLYRNDLDAAGSRAATGREAARRAGDLAIEARATSIQATVAQVRGEIHAAVRHHVRSFELADGAGEAHAAASFLVNVGLTRLDAGEPGPAIAALREGARRLARLDRDQDLARALYNLGLAAVLVGDDDLASSAIRRAREAAERCGDGEAEAYAIVLEAEIALRAGSLGAARAASQRAEARAREGSPRVRAIVAARRAMIHAALGDRSAADGALQAAREAAAVDRSAASLAELRVAEARIAILGGDAPAAMAAAAEARAEAEQTGSWEAKLRSLLASADAAELAGEGETARRSSAEARALLDRAASTLSPSARARLRDLPTYRKALSTVPEAGVAAAEDGSRWRRLAFLARRLTAERRVARLHEEIVAAAVELSGAERALLILREDDGRLRVRAARGLRAEREGGEEFSRSIAARAIDGGQVLSTVDALRDERMDGAASVHALSLRSVMAVPFRRRGEVAGAVYLEDRLRPAAFGPEDVALVSDLADLASIALDGAELLRAERRAARRLSILRQRLARRVETQALEIASLRRSSWDAEEAFPGIVANSAAMRRALDLVARVAQAEVPVLVFGESGTGKELVARAIHRHSRRADGPFVSENCGAIPEPLLESTLFGHVRGAFTGAEHARVGLFEAADGGTLFLDEIGEMSAAMQAKLLRAVQDGEIRAVGSERTRRVDVRIVAATHRDLEEMVRRGGFREDLYYRLAVVPVSIPPLRERSEDVAPLVAHFLAKHAPGREVRFDRRALARLAAFPWPGNVRQLENEVRRVLVMGAEIVREEDLSAAVRGRETAAPDEMDLKGQIQALERRLIRRALDASGDNQTKAAKLLGVSRYGLQKMMKRLDL